MFVNSITACKGLRTVVAFATSSMFARLNMIDGTAYPHLQPLMMVTDRLVELSKYCSQRSSHELARRSIAHIRDRMPIKQFISRKLKNCLLMPFNTCAFAAK